VISASGLVCTSVICSEPFLPLIPRMRHAALPLDTLPPTKWFMGRGEKIGPDAAFRKDFARAGTPAPRWEAGGQRSCVLAVNQTAALARLRVVRGLATVFGAPLALAARARAAAAPAGSPVRPSIGRRNCPV